MLAPRPIQRIGLDDILDAVGGSAAGPGEGLVQTAGSAIASDAQQGTLGMGTLTKAATAEQAREQAASAAVTSTEKSYDSFVDSTVSGVSGLAHDAAGAFSGSSIPGLGGVADFAAGAVDDSAHFAGGFAKEGFGIGAGLSRAVQDPLGFQQGLSAQGAKGAMPLGINSYVENLGKLSRGEEGLGDAALSVAGAYGQGQENEMEAKAAPLKGAIADASAGNYAGAAGRFGAQGLVAVLGMGEVGPLGEAAATGGGATAAETEAAAAVEEAAPATVRERLPLGAAAGKAGTLSPAGEATFNAAIAEGRTPEQALAEAQQNEAAGGAAAKAGAAGRQRVDPSVSPDAPPQARVVPMPEGLSPDAQSVFKSAIEGGQPPDVAEQLARDLDAAPGSVGPGPNARGNRAQRGPKRDF
jgi:hypothetical protein